MFYVTIVFFKLRYSRFYVDRPLGSELHLHLCFSVCRIHRKRNLYKPILLYCPHLALGEHYSLYDKISLHLENYYGWSSLWAKAKFVTTRRDDLLPPNNIQPLSPVKIYQAEESTGTSLLLQQILWETWTQQQMS